MTISHITRKKMIVSVFAKRVGNDVGWNMPKDKKPTQTDMIKKYLENMIFNH